MTATIDFNDWLDTNEPADNDDAYALNYAIQHKESCGIYEVQIKGEQMLIRVDGKDEWLRLASSKAIAFFQKRVDGYCPDPDLGWEGSEAYRRAMAKDD